MYFYKDYGGISYWVGDGFCDDINNNEACDYDDGDCCGLSSVRKNFCVQCICKLIPGCKFIQQKSLYRSPAGRCL